jgi:hypothetical protein
VHLATAAWLLISCGSPVSPAAEAYQSAVNGIQALHSGLSLPEHFRQPGAVRTGEEFDPNQYFGVLKHIHMQTGYTLDYVYRYDDFGGLPIFYSRPVTQERYPTSDAMYQGLGPGVKTDDYLAWVETDGSEAGFFELSVLRRMGGQFYLWWHAAYNDAEIVCTPSGLDQVFSQPGLATKVPDDIQTKARRLNLAPRVTMNSTSVNVDLVYFSKSTGFVGLHTTYSRSFPHQVLEEKSEVLLKYDFGVIY